MPRHRPLSVAGVALIMALCSVAFAASATAQVAIPPDSHRSHTCLPVEKLTERIVVRTCVRTSPDPYTWNLTPTVWVSVTLTNRTDHRVTITKEASHLYRLARQHRVITRSAHPITDIRVRAHRAWSTCFATDMAKSRAGFWAASKLVLARGRARHVITHRVHPSA